MKRLRLLLLILLLPCCVQAQGGLLAWLNSVRQQADASPVEEDSLLSRTAALWAARLAAAGILSHRGDDGSTGLDRYRAQGGTEVRVGEILGAGPALADIKKGWMESGEHRQLAVSTGWTHAGWGSAPSGAGSVVVMMFTEKLVEALRVEEGARGLSVSGRFRPRGVRGVILYSGLDPVMPSEWDFASRRFLFEVPGPNPSGYYRLGYVAEGRPFTLTNAFTWPRGRESPEAEDHSSAPVPSP